MEVSQVEDRNSNSGSESRARSLISQPTDETAAYRDSNNRIESFDSYPPNSPVNILHLAKAGFYYIPRKDFRSSVTCCGCSKIVNVWSSGDVPSNRRFHQIGCPFVSEKDGSQGGRSGSSRNQPKASVFTGEESTKPHTVGTNIPHASLPNFIGRSERVSHYVQHLPTPRGHPSPASVPTIVQSQTRVQTYQAGQEGQTFEHVETTRTSSHGRSDERGRESPTDIYGSSDPRQSFLGSRSNSNQSGIVSGVSYQPEEEYQFQSQPTSLEPSYTSRLENSQDLQTFLNGLDMKIAENRLYTFQELWSDDMPFRNTRLLVVCGFYCIGQGDAVQCFHCNAVIANWSRNDNPRRRHEDLSPDCQFLLHGDCGDQPLTFQPRSMRRATPVRSLSSSTVGSFQGQSLRSFAPPRNHSSGIYSEPVTRNERHHSTSSRYLEPPSEHSRQSSVRTPSPLSSSYNRGPPSAYQLSPSHSRHSSAHSSHHSRNSSISPQRGASHMSHMRAGRSPGRIVPSPGPIHHQIRQPSPFQPGHISQPYQEGPPAYPPAPPAPPIPQARNNWAAQYPCLDAHYPAMRDSYVRERSFCPPFPRLSRLNASYHDLAEAGFYYLGQRDRVCCFYCGGGLENFDPGDEIWTEHAKFYPHCEFLLQQRGPHFVENIAARFRDVRPVPVQELPMVESGPDQLPPPPPRTLDPQLLQHQREDLLNEGMFTEPVEVAREYGYAENMIREVQWKNIYNFGTCYQTSEALINALIDATDELNPPNMYRPRRPAVDQIQRQNPQPPTATQNHQTQRSQPAMAQPSANQRRRNSEQTAIVNGEIHIGGVPMSQFMANIFDTPFFRGEAGDVFGNDTNTTTTVIRNGNQNSTVRRTYRHNVISNRPGRTRQHTTAPAAPAQPPTTPLNIPGIQQHNAGESSNNNVTPGPSSSNETASASENSGSGSTQTRLDMLEKERACKVCLTNESNILFQPCGHICCCSDCSLRTEQCPICRAAIASKVRTYRS